jgi:tetratricopeptide (TPR) repeat protein
MPVIEGRFFMLKLLGLALAGVFFGEFMVVSACAQASQKPASVDARAAVERGISLTEKGECKSALPILKEKVARVSDKQLKYRALMALTRCSMSLDQNETAVNALSSLNREFPHDPETLYISTHLYSELASRASRELLATAPSSYQVHKLNAEGFESQGKWDEATAEYRKILEKNPHLPEIHYRLGRILLAEPATPTTTVDASREFEEELKIDPNNASAEFMLGEIARQAGKWDVAVQHFSRSANLDAGFSEAYLALGMSLCSAGNFSQAISPLEKYVHLEDADPAGHYQLAIAYARTGNREAAQREMARQTELTKASGGSAPPGSTTAH